MNRKETSEYANRLSKRAYSTFHLRQIGTKMNTLQIINDSALPSETKDELRLLVEQFMTAQNVLNSGVSDIHKTRASLNERQYAKILAEPMSDEMRLRKVLNQYGWRNWFVGSVYRTLEARRSLQILHNRIIEKIGAIAADHADDATVTNALVALKSLVCLENVLVSGNPEDVLDEMTKVKDISPGKLEDTVREVFMQKKSGNGFFADKSFNCVSIVFAIPPSPEQAALCQGRVAAGAAYNGFTPDSDELFWARRDLNLPQFVARLEKAVACGDKDNFDRIMQAQKAAEARVYLAATRVIAVLPDYKAAVERFAAVLEQAVSAIGSGESLEELMSMSNCIESWSFLHHMNTRLQCFTEEFYNPAVAIEQLIFDVDAYIKA
jgi:hypothetical protein